MIVKIRRLYEQTKADKLKYHNDWLFRMGVHPTQLKNKLKPLPDICLKPLPTSDRVGNGFVRGKSRYSGQGVFVGQAYNKGNLVVLSSKEASDSATGKRR